MSLNKILFFVAGAAVGAAGAAFISSPKGQKVIAEVIQGGAGLKENVATRMETLKEDIEDYVAEAKFKREPKKQAPGKSEETPDQESSEASA